MINWNLIFNFKGNKISAKINDIEFYKRVDKGESFAKGDVLEVELEVKQILKVHINTFINKSYKIRRIINHEKEKDKQIDLNNCKW